MIKKVVIVVQHNVFSYLISEGISNVFKNKKSTGASLTIMCATLLIFGIVFVIVKNIEGQQGMRVFLNDVSEIEAKAIGEKIKKIDGVNTMKYVSKAEALEEAKEKYKDRPLTVAGYTEKNSPFPASYIITLKDLGQSKDVQGKRNQI